MTPLHNLRGTFCPHPHPHPSVSTSRTSNETAQPSAGNACEQAHPDDAADNCDTAPHETPSQWIELNNERRPHEDRWRRSLTSVDVPGRPAAGRMVLDLDERLRTLTRIWRDTARRNSFSKSCSSAHAAPDAASPLRYKPPSAVFGKVLAQMTPLIGAAAAHGSAHETEKLVPIAQRIDEIDEWIEARGPDHSPPDLLEQRNTIVAALVDHDVYFDESVPEILPQRVRRQLTRDHNGPGESGFFGAAYSDTLIDKVYVANRGTEAGIAGRACVDWQHNLRQSLGLRSSQYTDAIDWAQLMAWRYPASKLVFTGHSLGGGLASAQTSVIPLSRGVTFATAGLHNSTIARYSAAPATTRIKAYHVDGEVLSVVQEIVKGIESAVSHFPVVGRAMAWFTRMTIPHPVGERIGVRWGGPPLIGETLHQGDRAMPAPSPKKGISGAIEKHSMLRMIYSLFDNLSDLSQRTRLGSGTAIAPTSP